MSNPFVPIHKAEIDWVHDLPFSRQYNDVYFSTASGLDQSRHVFINGNQLTTRWKSLASSSTRSFTIAETGFGTGLNFLHTWKLWLQHTSDDCTLHYFACEKHPLALDDLRRALSIWPALSTEADELMSQYPVLTPGFHQLSFANGRVQLTLMLGDALECFEQLLICGDSLVENHLRSAYVDAWFLDGFAPAKNLSMWSEPLFQTIAMLSSLGTTYATYTASGVVKHNLQEVGFSVNKVKGFGPKRHMLCGELTEDKLFRLKTRMTPWQATRVNCREKKVIIIGAGLAGCFIAYVLSLKGWEVTLLEEQSDIALGASGNQQTVLFPKLSAYRSPFTQFMLSSFLYASRFYRSIQNELPGELNGCLLLAQNNKESISQHSLKEWLAHYPELGELVDSSQASELSGIDLEHGGLYIPLSGWLNSVRLCHYLIARPNIHLKTCTTIQEIKKLEDYWHIDGYSAPYLILANGYKVNHFRQTKHLPIKPIRGQMTMMHATEASAQLKIPVCGDGHVVPASDGLHWFGATYDLGVRHQELKTEDDLINQHKLEQMTGAALWPKTIASSWSGVRATTPDYLPLVGPVHKADEFLKTFSGLESNSKRWIANTAPCYEGLYSFAGFGSRGLTTIPLCAAWLASTLNCEMSLLPRSLIQAISPARFLRKQIIRK